MIASLIGRYTAVSPEPSPSPTKLVIPDESLVTPGVGGFLVVVLIVLVVFLLIWDMIRRVRRVNYRAEIVERLEAERDGREIEDTDASVADEASEDRPGNTP